MTILATGKLVGGAQEHTGLEETGSANLDFEDGDKLT